jgi:hypothetical protein
MLGRILFAPERFDAVCLEFSCSISFIVPVRPMPRCLCVENPAAVDSWKTVRTASLRSLMRHEDALSKSHGSAFKGKGHRRCGPDDGRVAMRFSTPHSPSRSRAVRVPRQSPKRSAASMALSQSNCCAATWRQVEKPLSDFSKFSASPTSGTRWDRGQHSSDNRGGCHAANASEA